MVEVLWQQAAREEVADLESLSLEAGVDMCVFHMLAERGYMSDAERGKLRSNCER